MFSAMDYRLGTRVLAVCQQQNLLLGGAESCTGGLVAALLTSIPGSSKVFSHSCVTYAYEAKIDLLGVPQEILLKKGAVAGEVACIMARGACATANASIGYGITGVAGPGFSDRKPAGLVFVATSFSDYERVTAYRFSGNRKAVRLASVRQTLCDILAVLTLAGA